MAGRTARRLSEAVFTRRNAIGKDDGRRGGGGGGGGGGGLSTDSIAKAIGSASGPCHGHQRVGGRVEGERQQYERIGADGYVDGLAAVRC